MITVKKLTEAQGSDSLESPWILVEVFEKSLNSMFPWKVLKFLCKSLNSRLIIFNFECI